MMKRIAFAAGVAAGYVLGTRAGQKRYEQIKTRADQVWSSEPVQEKVQAARATLHDKAPLVAEKVAAATRAAGAQVGAQVKERVQGEDLPETRGRRTDGGSQAGTSGAGPGANPLP